MIRYACECVKCGEVLYSEEKNFNCPECNGKMVCVDIEDITDQDTLDDIVNKS